MSQRMNWIFSAGPRMPALKMALTTTALAGLLLAGGCGKAPEPVTEAAPSPSPTPTSTKPSLVVQPPTNAPATPPPAARVVYVATAFQAVNSDGTHDFPARAAVNVVAEEGEEYVIEYQGISVRTPKAFFTETLVEEASQPEPSPVAAAPTPDTIPLSPAAEVPTTATAEPLATPDPAMATDGAKATELINEIKTLNDEIRTASDKLEVAPAAAKSEDAVRLEKLKKRRDRLSEDLTEVAKP